jgi:hypothetical protein
MAVSQFLGDLAATLGSPKMTNHLSGMAKQSMAGGLLGEIPANMPGIISGFGGGTWNADGSQATPVNQGDQLEQMPFEMAMLEQQAPMGGQKRPGGGLLSFLGKSSTRDAMGQIGDYLLQANDMAPIYGPRKERADKRMIGDKLAQYLGTSDPILGEIARINPEAGMAMLKMRQEQQNRVALEQEQARLKASQPDISTINNRRVKIDPTTGESKVLYTAPQDFDDYAASLGAEPGTAAYKKLVQDYVLRGSGPTATDFNMEEEGQRQGNRVDLEGVRQRNRTALRGVPTYRQANPAPRAPVGGGAAAGSKRFATNPKTGERLELKGGKWVPAGKGGQTATPSGGFR